jgi:hypothetical protein
MPAIRRKEKGGLRKNLWVILPFGWVVRVFFFLASPAYRDGGEGDKHGPSGFTMDFRNLPFRLKPARGGGQRSCLLGKKKGRDSRRFAASAGIGSIGKKVHPV